jgi:hypothetical protein
LGSDRTIGTSTVLLEEISSANDEVLLDDSLSREVVLSETSLCMEGIGTLNGSSFRGQELIEMGIALCREVILVFSFKRLEVEQASCECECVVLLDVVLMVSTLEVLRPCDFPLAEVVLLTSFGGADSSLSNDSENFLVKITEGFLVRTKLFKIANYP